MRKRIVFFIVAIILSINFMLVSPIINPIYNEPVEVVKCSAYGLSGIKDFFKNIFVGKSNNDTEDDYKPTTVYVGGNPLGFTVLCDGVIVVAISNVLTEQGSKNPTAKSNIKEGDVLISLSGQRISSAVDIDRIINSETLKGKEIDAEIIRGNQKIKTTISPEIDTFSKSYKLGLWIRDNAAGVGTLTYVREDNKRFGALGHPVCDIDTGAAMSVRDGNIFNCNIVAVNKGKRGTPGELRGMFLKTGKEIGKIDKNCDVGVFGSFSGDVKKFTNGRKMQTASKQSVKTGKAQILCTISSTEPKLFDIEIVKLNYQSSLNKKSMVIRVVDEELINLTGGIVQGMSGSPIIQNGKLVGAMTHVFVNDPTKGFAVYIDNMINN